MRDRVSLQRTQISTSFRLSAQPSVPAANARMRFSTRGCVEKNSANAEPLILNTANAACTGVSFFRGALPASRSSPDFMCSGDIGRATIASARHSLRLENALTNRLPDEGESRRHDVLHPHGDDFEPLAGPVREEVDDSAELYRDDRSEDERVHHALQECHRQHVSVARSQAGALRLVAIEGQAPR